MLDYIRVIYWTTWTHLWIPCSCNVNLCTESGEHYGCSDWAAGWKSHSAQHSVNIFEGDEFVLHCFADRHSSWRKPCACSARKKSSHWWIIPKNCIPPCRHHLVGTFLRNTIYIIDIPLTYFWGNWYWSTDLLLLMEEDLANHLGCITKPCK